jgi:hypothetical protein
MVGDHYTTTLTAAGGSGGYQWTVVDHGGLPAGLSLDAATGIISGVPLPAAQGTSTLSIQVADSSGTTAPKSYLLTVNPALKILKEIDQETAGQIRLQAAGGAGREYTWQTVGGTVLPAGVQLDPATGRITISGNPRAGSAQVTIRVSDAAPQPHTDDTSLIVRVRRQGITKRDQRLDILGALGIGARIPISFRWMSRPTFWLAVIAFWTPLASSVPIFVFAFTSQGQHGRYLAVGLLTAIAALVAGCLFGFLFGLPKVATVSGQPAYSPSTNLPDVSDWLTKLLLGAGLVQLTHLGPPVADLIDHVAKGMSADAASADSAKVLAGAIVFGYTGIGLIAGYVVTAVWYLRKLNRMRP